MKTPEETADEIGRAVCRVASDLWANDEQASKFAAAIRDTWLAGYEAAQERVASADGAAPQWISVKDRLPEEHLSVLWLTGKAGKWDCGRSEGSCSSQFCVSANGCGESFDRGVCYLGYLYERNKKLQVASDHLAGEIGPEFFSHWMPLPEAPKDVA